MVLEEPSWMSEGRVGVMNELVRGSRDLNRVERKVDKAETHKRFWTIEKYRSISGKTAA